MVRSFVRVEVPIVVELLYFKCLTVFFGGAGGGASGICGVVVAVMVMVGNVWWRSDSGDGDVGDD